MRDKPEFHLLAQRMPCTRCGASAGQPCIVPRTGKDAAQPHVSRIYAAEDAGLYDSLDHHGKLLERIGDEG